MSSRGRLIVILTLAVALCACLEALSATISGALRSRPSLTLAAATSTRPYAITPTTVSNELTARQDASTLLSELILPPGATGSPVEPQDEGGVLGAPLTTPGTTAFVDVHAWWTLPGSQQAVLRYIRAHPPRGATITSPESWVIELSWPPVSGVLGSREVIVEAVTLKGGAVGIRADAQDVYILARPANERIPSGVRDIDFSSVDTDPGGAPLLSMHITRVARVRSIVDLFDSLDLDQQTEPIRCLPTVVTKVSPKGTVTVIRDVPIVTVTFRSFPGGPAMGRASFLAEGAGTTGAGGCNAIWLSFHGLAQRPLAGSVLAPLRKLLGVNLATGARTAPPGPPTTAANRLIALRDVHTLLADVRVPAGATRSAAEPRGDGGWLRALPGLGGSLAQFDAHEWWVCACSEGAMLDFVATHRPHGSTQSGSGEASGPTGRSSSYFFSWLAIAGVLGNRELWVTVTSLADGQTGVLASAESVWIVTRPPSEQIPAGVNKVRIRGVSAGNAPTVSLTITDPAKVRRIVSLFDSLQVHQPAIIYCPALPAGPDVTFSFYGGAVLAQATVLDDGGYNGECNPISFSLGGRQLDPLVGNAIGPMQQLLGVSFGTPAGPFRTS